MRFALVAAVEPMGGLFSGFDTGAISGVPLFVPKAARLSAFMRSVVTGMVWAP